jgi:TonB family protein
MEKVMRAKLSWLVSMVSVALMSGQWARIQAQDGPAATTSATPDADRGGAPSAEGEQPKKIGGSVLTPKLTHSVDPQFSDQAREQKKGGTVLVSLVVDKLGVPQNVHVLRGVGLGLDEKAVDAVKQYRFKSATENGRPVSVYMTIEINFRIYDKDGKLQ